MARYKIDCCYNCQRRIAGCHGSCEDYKKQRAEYDETLAELRKKGDIRRGLNQQMSDSIDRVNKRLNRKDGKHGR